MRLKITQTNDREKLKQIVIGNRLYVRGWTLREDVENGWYSKACVAWDGRKPVGVCLLKENGALGTYVRPSHRRKKIGTRLIKAITKRRRKPVFGLEGLRKVSEKFYSSLSVDVRV